MRYQVKRTLTLDKSEVSCILCKKICKGERSLKSHITQMHSGDKDTSHRGKPKGIAAWNKGLDNTDSRVSNGAKRYKERLTSGEISPGFKGRSHTDKTRDKISKSLSGNNKGGRCKWYEVNGVNVQGTWERDFATCLSDRNIKWEKVSKWLEEYVADDGTLHRYTPDFYLKDFDVYIELKGFWWGNDKRKMEIVKAQSKHKIVVIEKDEFKRFLDGELVW